MSWPTRKVLSLPCLSSRVFSCRQGKVLESTSSGVSIQPSWLFDPAWEMSWPACRKGSEFLLQECSAVH